MLTSDPGSYRGLISILPVFLHLSLQDHEHYTHTSRAKGCWIMSCHASYCFTEVCPNMSAIIRKCQLIKLGLTQPKHVHRTSISSGNGKQIFKFSYYLIEHKLSRPGSCEWLRRKKVSPFGDFPPCIK